MQNSRMEKAIKNIFWITIYEITSFVCGLILPRLILKNFGSSYNGITSSVTQFLNFVSILRLGVAGATRASLYKPLAENDTERISDIVMATEKYLRKIGGIIIIYIILLAVFYPKLVDTGIEAIDVSVLVVALGIGVFAQYFFGITYQTLLSAEQSIYVYNIVQIISTIANTMISVILIKMNYSIQIVKLGSAVTFFVSPFVLRMYVLKKYKLNKKSAPDNNALSQKKDVMGHSIANIIHEHTDVTILTLFCDVKIVSVYTIYNLVMAGLNKVLIILTSGTESIFGNMWAKGEKNTIKNYLGIYEFVIGIFVSILFSATFALILPFISLYTVGIHDVEYIRPVYAIVIILAQIFYCFCTPYLTLVQGVGHYQQTKNGAYMEAIINVVISVILVNFIGMIGTAIGTFIANVFRTLQYSVYVEKNIIDRGIWVVFKRMIWAFANILISLIIEIPIIVYVFNFSGWIDWVICAVVIVAISSVICIITSCIFYKRDLKELLDLLKRIINIKKIKKGV